YMARFYRIAGRESFLLTGTDEHGAKVAEAAEAAGKKPQEFCDEVVKTFKSAWKALDICESDFIRTTDERHLKGVKEILLKMKDAKTPAGDDVVYQGEYEGLYCTACERYYVERELENGLCPFHKTKPELVKEKNWFFRLSAFLPEIKKRIESEELLILPIEKRREVLGLIEQELPDFSLSREKVEWGIPLPFDKDQSAYVWVDALTNYISAIGFGHEPDLFEKWWNNAEVVHLMAKDILKFHCLFWPAMLLAAGVKLPERIFLHGFFTVDGNKMSKTLGNKIDPHELVGHFGVDAARYLLVTPHPFGQDGDIQTKRLSQKYNSDLANDLGNLVSRVIKMVERGFDGKIPDPGSTPPGGDALEKVAMTATANTWDDVKNFRLNLAIERSMELVRETNRFFDQNAPWKLQKEGKTAEMGSVLRYCCEVLRIVSILYYPIMPSKMSELRNILGLSDESLNLKSAEKFMALESGALVKMSGPLFPRIDKDFVPGKSDKSKSKSNGSEESDGLIDISEFGKLKLVVAEIKEVAKVDGADRLLRLQIDVGGGGPNRQIVAGVAEHYTPEQLKGKKIIVVSNLKPAVIRGVKSQGMLLAAKKGKKLTLIAPADDIPAGASVG
ncbi:MAG: methionine--tRNA ligase, partial [candidate division Zixibacteria bacterium]|nr:methionine--tRNA ligase [candidate division Zixibacteria bacterium]